MDRDIVIAFASWVGGGKKKGQKSITDGVIRNIESLMIAEFKPRLNGVGVKKYKGPKLSVIAECPDDPDWGDLNWEIYED
jgi:hypothetical protein